MYNASGWNPKVTGSTHKQTSSCSLSFHCSPSPGYCTSSVEHPHTESQIPFDLGPVPLNWNGNGTPALLYRSSEVDALKKSTCLHRSLQGWSVHILGTLPPHCRPSGHLSQGRTALYKVQYQHVHVCVHIGDILCIYTHLLYTKHNYTHNTAITPIAPNTTQTQIQMPHLS